MNDKSKIKLENDSFWARIVKRNAGGRCELCGRQAVHAHHVIKRANMALRWNVDNGAALCAQCHSDWHAAPRAEQCNYVHRLRRKRKNLDLIGHDGHGPRTAAEFAEVNQKLRKELYREGKSA